MLDTEARSRPGDDLQRWREVVFRRLLLAGSILGGANMLFWFAIRPGPIFDLVGLLSIVTVGFTTLLLFVPHWPLETRANSLIAVIFAFALIALSKRGFESGPPLTLIALIGFAMTMVSLRSAWVWLGLSVAGYLLVGIASSEGWIAPPHEAEWVTTNLANWLRATSVFGITAAILMVALGSVLERAESKYHEANQALLDLRREQEQHRQADEERRRAEAALEQAQRLEGLGRLAGGVAHDFNNALLVIMSWADLLRRDEDPSSRREGLDAIITSASQASQLTRDLLSFARENVARPTRVDLRPFLSATTRSLRRLLPEKIEIEFEGDVDAQIEIAEGHLSQILLNLAINASDAMPDGGCLRIGLASREVAAEGSGTPQRWAEIRVEDTGTGMDENTRSRIFEPYFTTKPAGLGTGLGLASVHGLVNQNGGRIEVSSRPDRGSCFLIAFPQLPPEATPGRVTLPKRAERPRGTILLVEDNELVRKALARTIARSGFSIVEATDGRAALDLARRHRDEISMLFTDAVMPGIPVAELIAEFRRLFPDTPVIVCSGMVQEELVRHGILGGEIELVAKPFVPEALIAVIERVLGRATGEYPVPPDPATKQHGVDA